MGIRWYGWAVTSDEAAIARVDPWLVIWSADTRHREPGWTNGYLDKAWWWLQGMFAEPTGETGAAPRPAHDLVAGAVSYPNGLNAGHQPYVGVIAAGRVREIADDLQSITQADVVSYCRNRGEVEEVSYLVEYLEAATHFALDASSRGHAVVYVIQ